MTGKRGEAKKTVRRKMPWAAAILIAVAAVGGLIWTQTGGEAGGCIVEGPIYADSADAGLVGLGREIYAANCAACHGANLEGQPNWRSRLPGGALPAPPHDETGHTWHHPDRQLFSITKCGGAYAAPKSFVSAMPGFGDSLSDREILASLAYIESRWPAPIRQRQDRASRQNP